MRRLIRLAIAAGIALVGPLESSAEPPSEPILRIEIGRHTARINRIATDAQGRFLVTASDDKTARIWDLTSGALLQTLRPAQGVGNEGKLYSVAMAPDGGAVAVGGWTGYVFLFDRASGRLLRRLTGLPNAVNELAWSPDGAWLAAGVGDSGIKLWRTRDWALIGEDRDYGGVVYGLDFSRDGRLAASSLDGSIRLYRVSGDGLRRFAKAAAPGGKRPYALRFSPDGARLTVGFSDSPAVNLLSGQTLEWIAAPDTRDLTVDQNLSKVAWSADGSRLYGAGSARDASNATVVRVWPDAGLGAPRDLPAAQITVTDLRPLPGGGVVVGSGEPAWTTFDAVGQKRLTVAPMLADLRGKGDELRLAADGQSLRFGYQESGKSPARFDLAGRRLQPGEDSSGLVSPRLSAPGLDVQDWKNTPRPTLNGQALALKQYEMSRSLALAADGEGFALGADWTLPRFDRNGKAVWQMPVPSVVWGVNVSQDGRFVVAAYGDGTIRWHRWSDGRELLAFFPHADKQRWVLWTPSGYYDTSPGGEELIGWHLNRGKDNAADFFPASRFRGQYYRPDIIDRIMQTLDEPEAVRLANQEAGRKQEAQRIQNLLPPVVDILSPGDGTVSIRQVTIRYNARTPADAPVTALRARVNGQAVSLPETRVLAVQKAGDGAREVTVPIPEQDAEIQLFAENKNGVSVPSVLRLKWAGSKPPPKQEEQFKPKLYVLAVGVSKYANPEYNLGLAAKDANDFVRVLQAQKGKLYADVQVRLLTDAKATRDDVVDGLEWLKREVTARDVGIMFLAGHGMNDNTGKYYFMPHNADPAKLLRTGVPQTDIRDTLNSLAGKAVFFVDTCHSGNALGTARTRSMGNDINAFVNELASAENGVVVFTAATGRQLSQEKDEWGNGAFTKAVVEGLSGKADFEKTGRITHKALDYYVAERVKALTKGSQSPVSIAPAGVTDFPVAVVGK